MQIQTIHGELDETLLEKLEGFVDNADEYTTWVEYRLIGSDEIVHRSVHVSLKKAAVFLDSEVSGF